MEVFLNVYKTSRCYTNPLSLWYSTIYECDDSQKQVESPRKINTRFKLLNEGTEQFSRKNSHQ